MKRLILGSQSPRRKQLLASAGFEFEVRVSNEPEDYPAEMSLPTIPTYLAEKKARALLPTLQADEVLICADSVVIWQGELLGKPDDLEHAKQIVRKLSGSTHEVITGVCVMTQNSVQTFAELTKVTFKPLTEAEIAYYIEKDRPLDKAGSYGIQDWIGFIGVSGIEGCFYNVMGLPISRLYDVLKEVGVPMPADRA
jgi:septum formation protein